MFENETQSVEQSDVQSPEAPSEPQQTSTSSETAESAPAQQAESKPTPDTEANVPFHQHPRFKELVAQKNEYAEKVKAFEAKMAEQERMLKQFQESINPKQPDKKQELISRLKGIDPEFGDLIESLESRARQAEELAQWKAQQEVQRTREDALSRVEKLHEEHKVAKEDRELYTSLIELEAARNPKATINDLPAIYKAVHEKMNSRYEAIKRAERESYVSGKKADSSIPTSQPKGKPVNQSKDFQFSKDPYEARQQIIQRVLKQAKDSNSL